MKPINRSKVSAYYTPWFGPNYPATETMIFSESAYSWVEKGEVIHPSPKHPERCVGWARDLKSGYFAKMNRALCGVAMPSSQQIEKAWNDYGYTIFVQRTVGNGAGTRPTALQWKDASTHFLGLIESLRPKKIILTGIEMWKRMPTTFQQKSDTLQAYRLEDGTLVWCLALPHPANRIQGFKWESIAKDIKAFRAAKLPRAAR